MLRNVLIVKLPKLYTVNSMYFLSALYMLRYVPIVKMTLVIFIQKKKKKKKKKRKMTRTLIWVKKYQSYATKTPLSIFSLGKGRESLHLQTLHKKKKKLSKVRFLPCPPQHTNHSDSDTVWMTHAKINKKLTKFSSLCRNFCTFPVTEGYTICNSISSSQPWQESSPTE